jgi:hypothetical protein
MVTANAEKTTGTVSLAYVVRSLQNKQKVFNNVDYMHLLQLAIDAVSELNVITLDTIETAFITIGDTNALELPNDYIDYVKIGFVGCNGCIWTLKLNNDLVRYPVQECGVPLDRVLGGFCEQFPEQFPTPTDGYYFGTGFHQGNTLPLYYGIGGGFSAGYRIDRQGRYLLISGLPKGTVICLEYKSTGIKIGETTYIPRQAVNTIHCHIMMTEQDFGNIQSGTDWTRKFHSAEALLSNMEYTRIAQEHLDSLYEHWHQGAKR